MEIIVEIILDLNKKGGFRYRPTPSNAKLINARLSEGYTKDDFFLVHTIMCAKWKDDETMYQYLRPATLYCASKFEGYLNTKPPVSKCVTPDWL